MTAPARPRTWVWTVAELAIRTFYRVHRVGQTVPSGPVLLVANHPNTLLDPAVIQTTAGRSVRFLAKSTLFGRHPLSFLVRQSGAIPVYRRIDQGVDTTRNVETFRAVEEALAWGEAICLFPEGLSHDHGRLEPLRTGAARMALAGPVNGRPVTIMPVGLNFDHLSAFRSRVTAIYGDPVAYEDLLDVQASDPPTAVRQLTDRITEALRRLMVEADPRRDLPVVERVERLYTLARGVSREPRARIIRRRRIASGLGALRARDPSLLQTLVAQLAEHDSRLERFGLRDRDVDQRITAGQAWRFTIREGALALFLAPLAVISLIVFVIPYGVTGRLSRSAPDLQSRATWKIAVGVSLYALWIGLLATAAGAQWGWPVGLASAAALAVLAFVGLVAIEREMAVLRTIKAFVTLRRTPLRTRVQLRRQRADLATVLERVADWVRGETDDALRRQGTDDRRPEDR